MPRPMPSSSRPPLICSSMQISSIRRSGWIEVDGVEQRPEAQPLGALGHGGQEHAGRRRHAEWRRVMLGQVIGMKTRALVELDQLQPLVELPAEISAGTIHVIEDTELHAFPRFAGCYKV